jgi:hypothetical protein
VSSFCLTRSLKPAGYAAAVVVGLLLLPGRVEAQTPVINACVNANNGNTRIVAATEACRNPEIRVQWNATGQQGEQGEKGDPGLTWRGAWDAQTAYLVDDAVEHDGSSYVANMANLNDAPPSASWDLLASKGDQGDPGEDGADGANGVNGTNGVDGDPGPAGPSGTTGQNATTASQTMAPMLTVVGQVVNLAGLATSVVVPDTVNGSVLVVSSDGGAVIGTTVNTFAIVDIRLYLDPPATPDPPTMGAVVVRRLSLLTSNANVQGLANWSFSISLPVTAGTHTVKMTATLVNANVAPTIGSNMTGSPLQGRLTAVVLNK